MRDFHFDWDTHKARSNLRKHGVSFEDAVGVFRDPFALTIFDEAHSVDEERWVTLGEINGNLLVILAHTWQDDNANVFVRLISARPATTHEIKQYQG